MREDSLSPSPADKKPTPVETGAGSPVPLSTDPVPTSTDAPTLTLTPTTVAGTTTTSSNAAQPPPPALSSTGGDPTPEPTTKGKGLPPPPTITDMPTRTSTPSPTLELAQNTDQSIAERPYVDIDDVKETDIVIKVLEPTAGTAGHDDLFPEISKNGDNSINSTSATPSKEFPSEKESSSLISSSNGGKERSGSMHEDFDRRSWKKEFLLWAYPCLAYATVLYITVLMGNYLSYLVRVDLRDRPSLQQPLQDYLLPPYTGKPPEEPEVTYLEVADGFAFSIFLVGCVWSLYERDRHILARALGLDGFLSFGKAIARMLTILPESAGPDYCDRVTAHMRTDTLLDYVRWIMHINYINCSDMMWSGHAQHLVGGAIIFGVLAHRHRSFYRFLQPLLARVLFNAVMWSIVVIGIVLMLLSRAHYSVDIFVGGLVTALSFSNHYLLWFFEKIFFAPDELKSVQILKQNAKGGGEPEPFRLFRAWRTRLPASHEQPSVAV